MTREFRFSNICKQIIKHYGLNIKSSHELMSIYTRLNYITLCKVQYVILYGQNNKKASIGTSCTLTAHTIEQTCGLFYFPKGSGHII